MNPQIFGVVMDRLYAAGALEVFYVPVQMKKNRPGHAADGRRARPSCRPALTDVIFRETTTIGLRHYEVERECLRREIVTVDTPLGAVRFKLAWRDGRVVNAVPEFDDCARIAAASNLSVKEVQAIADSGLRSAPLRVTRREPLLHHHADLLHQRRAAPRPRLHDDGGRRRGAGAPPAWATTCSF